MVFGKGTLTSFCISHIFMNKVYGEGKTFFSKNCETILSLFPSGLACLSTSFKNCPSRPLPTISWDLAPFSSQYGLLVSIYL